MTYKSKAVGSVTVEIKGLFAHITAVAYIKSNRVLKGYIKQGGGRLGIGVAEPLDSGLGALKCAKKISLSELKRLGLDLTEGFEAELLDCTRQSGEEEPDGFETDSGKRYYECAEGSWQKRTDMGEILSKNGFYNGDAEVFVKKLRDDKLLIGAPIRADLPYALAPAFSISTPVRTEYGVLGVVSLSGDGKLGYYE